MPDLAPGRDLPSKPLDYRAKIRILLDTVLHPFPYRSPCLELMPPGEWYNSVWRRSSSQ
ncbi:uncharacterized protein MYCFIDRAFT_172273 [Pseudocercospora fijiensis CIRAD86]|uniref:Uncharacterized protein n=1 Tax=Pseudocercospora fijiensis (strain CIRAD86) TaxID=383855 RepID=M3A5Z9_PSEFD|nr:uncharacterized protein MYCFIDRAFT_172273 [Pseudocercospora fijiensis CIRAD86]EME86544.1 hypothetical protein MYCFIDRAFT_172273 [Pseudocercospora fijiensis CIRAD86]